jgi:hypothetical protein
LDTFLLDLRFGLRTLSKSPGFTLVAIVMLAVGIGANVALFGLVSATLLRPPAAVREPERLAYLVGSLDGGAAVPFVSRADFDACRESARSFSGLAASAPLHLGLSGAGEPGRVAAVAVSDEYFDVLGAGSALGRAGGPDAASQTVVLSHAFWKSRYNSSRKVLGRAIELDGHAYTIAAVAPEGFTGTKPQAVVDVWVPLDAATDTVEVVGRLAPGVDFEQARAEVETIAARLEGGDRAERVTLVSRTTATDDLIAVSGLTIVVGLVLVIACANVANISRSGRRSARAAAASSANF